MRLYPVLTIALLLTGLAAPSVADGGLGIVPVAGEAIPNDSASPAACPADFGAFWQRALSQCQPLQPGALTGTGGDVIVPVTDTLSMRAWWQPGTDPAATPVVHLVERANPEPARRPVDRRAHLYVSWRSYDCDLATWYLQGLAHPGDGGLMASVLAACQAVDLVRTSPELTAPLVALVGDGYGAVMALAAAALAPERVSFVIVHQPRPAFHRMTDGTFTACPAIARILSALPATDANPTCAALSYYDAVNFAARATRPTFVIAGGRDRDAPVSEARMLYDKLTCKRNSLVVPTMRHHPSDSMSNFAQLLARADAIAQGPTAAPIGTPVRPEALVRDLTSP